jgi:hypothetical protein
VSGARNVTANGIMNAPFLLIHLVFLIFQEAQCCKNHFGCVLLLSVENIYKEREIDIQIDR